MRDNSGGDKAAPHEYCMNTVSTGPASKDALKPTGMAARATVTSASPDSPAALRMRAVVAARSSELAYGMPPFREGFVRRDALVERLSSARDATVALIVAPAGYGKSTLLADWAEFDERPFVRLAIDQRDGDAIATSIVQPFSDLGWIGPEVKHDLASVLQRDGNAALPWLLRCLHCEVGECVVVLDDANAIRAPLLRAVVMALTEQMRQGSQVALASRVEPPLPVGRLRAHRALIELRTDDLKMSPTEAASLLRSAGLEPKLDELRALLELTEGWPAGLYLAALSLRSEHDPVAGLRGFGGGDPLIAEYFRDELLSALSPDTARFLIRSSVLDELSGPLCDATLKQRGSAMTLARLARSDLMLAPLDRKHERFRLHGLFREMLQAELRRIEPEVETRLHRRASTWLRRHHDVDRAIDHAVAADDVERTGDLLWANMVAYVSHGRTDIVQGWLSRFSTEQIADYAPLALAAAHSWLATGKVVEARRWGLLAREAVERGRAAKGTESLGAGIAIIEAMAPRVAAVDMARAATRALELEPEHSAWRPVCYLLRGTADFLTGHCQSAKQQLEEGVQLSGGAAPTVTALCLAQLVILAIEHDDWETATELADRATIVVDGPWLSGYPLSALVFAVSAATRAHQGRADEAKRDLRHAADLLAVLGDFLPWYGAEARIMLARAALGLADTVRARTLLAEASRLARATAGVVIFQRYFDQAWGQIDTLAETALLGPSSLTIAELRILRFLPSHRSFREIAERLDVSVNTVKTQAHAIYRKLDAASRSEAVAHASRAGLLGA